MLGLSGKKQGILLMILSALSFSAMQIVVSLSGDRIPVLEQVFFRNIVGLVVSFILITKRKGSYFGTKKDQPILFSRSFFGFLGIITLFYAVNHAHQADVTILSKMSPFLITIFAAIFLKEKISKMQIPAMILAFIGAFLVANPTFNSNYFPLIIAFCTSITASICYTLLAYMKGKVDPQTILFHLFVFCSVASIPFMIGNFVVPTWTELIYLILIGIFGWLGQITITLAYQKAPAAEVSVYNYTGIIFSMILGYVILGENVSATSYIGGGLVVAASILIYWYNNRLKGKKEETVDPGKVEDTCV